MTERREGLRALLSSHVPADEVERAHLRRSGALLGSPADPFSRDHYEPGHFTASAFILSPGADALLLIFHDKLERWLQPGGHVEPGDASLLDAARREVAEEVGLSGLPLATPGVFDVDVHDIPERGLEPRHGHYDVRFLFRAQNLGFERTDEVRDTRWVPLDEIGGRSSDRSVTRAVEKLQSELAG